MQGVTEGTCSRGVPRKYDTLRDCLTQHGIDTFLGILQKAEIDILLGIFDVILEPRCLHGNGSRPILQEVGPGCNQEMFCPIREYELTLVQGLAFALSANR